jgi:hypothetical protein
MNSYMINFVDTDETEKILDEDRSVLSYLNITYKEHQVSSRIMIQTTRFIVFIREWFLTDGTAVTLAVEAVQAIHDYFAINDESIEYVFIRDTNEDRKLFKKAGYRKDGVGAFAMIAGRSFDTLSFKIDRSEY